MAKKVFVFPGQGAQFVGMANDLISKNSNANQLLNEADDILGFKLSQIMKDGTIEELTQTKVTQPAIFVHSVITSKSLSNDIKPDFVAGHSLGEFSALVANNTISFKEGLSLVSKRALAMQKACDLTPSTMAAVLGVDDGLVEQICNEVSQSGHVVVAANYNCPGQLVISGSIEGVNMACEKLKAAGAKRAMVLQVGGAFHSPIMMPAQEELKIAIENTNFNMPICPIYQNVTAQAHTDPNEIKQNLILQLTAPVKWTQMVLNMVADGANEFTELGPGKVLQGLIKKISPTAIILQ